MHDSARAGLLTVVGLADCGTAAFSPVMELGRLMPCRCGARPVGSFSSPVQEVCALTPNQHGATALPHHALEVPFNLVLRHAGHLVARHVPVLGDLWRKKGHQCSKLISPL